MRNVCLDVALFELDQAGIRDVQRVRGAKHLQLRWQTNGHGLRIYSIPGSPSDWRTPKNVRSDIRRMLREDGIAVASKPESPSSPPPPLAPLPDRIDALERRVARLEELIQRLEQERQSHHNG